MIKELDPVIKLPNTLYTKDHSGIGLCYKYREYIDIYANSGTGYILKSSNSLDLLKPASLLM